MPTSVALLKRALDLLDAEPDHLKRAEVLVELGDPYILNGQPRSARPALRGGVAGTVR